MTSNFDIIMLLVYAIMLYYEYHTLSSSGIGMFFRNFTSITVLASSSIYSIIDSNSEYRHISIIIVNSRKFCNKINLGVQYKSASY